MTSRSTIRRAARATTALLLVSIAFAPARPAGAAPPPDIFVGVRVRPNGEQLVSRFSSMLLNRSAEKTITGLQTNETIVAIDAAPGATSEVFAITTSSSAQRLYRLNVSTGGATLVGAFTETLDAAAGLDYNPVTNQLRVVLANGKNFRLSPRTGGVVDSDPTTEGVQRDASVGYAPGDANATHEIQVVALANTNNVPGAGSTITYGWDRNRGTLVRIGDQDPPTSTDFGRAHTVGAAAATWGSSVTSMEIAPSGRSYVFAVDPATGAGKLGRVDLTTAVVTPVSEGFTLSNYIAITSLRAVPATTETAQLFGLTENNEIVPISAPAYDATGPAVAINGTTAGDPIRAIETRGVDGRLYGLTRQGRLFTINPSSGDTAFIGLHGHPVPNANATDAPLGIDWNPVTDQFRVVAGLAPTVNFRIDPSNGLGVDSDPGTDGAQRDADLAFAAGDVNNAVANPRVADIAHSNNAASATSTTVWGIEALTWSIVRVGGSGAQSPGPELGQIFTFQSVAHAGAFTAPAGFEILPSGVGVVALPAPTGTVFLQLTSLNADLPGSPVTAVTGSMPIRLISLASAPAAGGTTPTTTSTSTTSSTTTVANGATTTTAPTTTSTTALPPGQGDAVHRVAGADRIATAIAVSKGAYPQAGSAAAVVLARADLFPDALTGTPLATAKNGPLLLTNSDALHGEVEAEIKRVLPAGGRVYLLGGDTALAPSVATKLQGAGFNVARLSGDDRYGTAVSVAINGLGSPSTILLATGLDFPDALSAGPAAAKVSGGVLLTAGAAMPLATKTYLDRHPTTTRYAIGLQAASADPGATGVVGTDRYDTSRRVAEQFFAAPYPVVGVASGTVFPDGLSGGAHVGELGGPLLLSAPTFLPPVITEYLLARKQSITSAVAYGGPSALSDAVLDSVRTDIT